MEKLETLYTVEEAAEFLKVSVRTMGNWLRNGKVRGIKLGRSWRIPESALEEAAEKGIRED